MHQAKGSLLSSNRHTLVKLAFDAGADYILWIDSDVRFPPDLLFRLLRWNKDIVGCNYPQKTVPSFPTAALDPKGLPETFPEEMKFVVRNKMQFLITRPGQQGLVKCIHLGFGALLMKTECFRKVPPPWFDITWKEENQNYEGEDVCCLRRMREAGYDVFCDMDTSNLITHIGDFEYAHDLVEGYAAPVKEGEKDAS